MIKFITKRILIAIPTLLIIVAFSFSMMRVAPGGPFTNERALPPEIERNIKAAYNLDKPVYEQFYIYIKNLTKGDFGPSFKYKDFSVKELILNGLPVSVTLGLSSIIISLFIGSLLGIIAAINRNTVFDYSVMGVSLVGICVPSFVMAPLLSLFFSLYLGILPTSGWNNGNILNLILPIIEYLAPASAGLMTGSIIIEQIFGLPGIGRYFVVGALQRDYTLVSGVLILYASLLIFLILITDIIRAILDPRVKI